MSILRKLKNKLFRVEDLSSGQNESNAEVEFPQSKCVFLIGFSYDRPTKETFSWIRNLLPNAMERSNVLRFHDDNFSRETLEQELRNEFERVEIFCGHGDIDGLYGPPYNLQSPDILKNIHTIIYDGEMVCPGPSAMFAFCCSAGDSFGRVFSSLPGNTFMGFKGDLYFPRELYGDLKNIFQILANDIIQTGIIEKRHEKIFIEEIDKLISNVQSKYKYADLMGSYLLEYRELFIAYV